jgi:hypothetical protein
MHEPKLDENQRYNFTSPIFVNMRFSYLIKHHSNVLYLRTCYVFSHCLMMDKFSDACKLLGLLEPEDASKTLLRNNSKSFTLDTGRHISQDFTFQQHRSEKPRSCQCRTHYSTFYITSQYRPVSEYTFLTLQVMTAVPIALLALILSAFLYLMA